MRTAAAGPSGVMLAGQVLNIPDEFAEQLIAGGFATRIDILAAAQKAIENTAADLSLRELRAELKEEVSLQEAFDKAVEEKAPEVKRGRGRPKENKEQNA